MRQFPSHLFFVLASISLVAETTATANDDGIHEQIFTKDGREFSGCLVKRADEEGIVIEHSGGMARISFFDLSSEWHDRYDFDPVAAMQAHRRYLESEQKILKEQTLALIAIRAEAEQKTASEELQKKAVDEWTPVEAHIVSVRENGAFAFVRKVRFEPTTVVSRLGFKRPGPPERLSEPFGSGLLFLHNIAHEFAADSWWNGYIEPASTHRVLHPDTGEKSVPVHLAVPPP